MEAIQAASIRERARLLLRQSRRVLRRHYWSAITLAVLVGALALVLRSPSFDGGAVEEESPVAVSQPHPAEFLSSLKSNEALPGYRITFYLYTHEAQRRSVEEMVREYLIYLRSQGYPDGVMEVNYLPVRDAEEEETARLLIRDVGSWVAGSGIHLSVIDLRALRRITP